MLAGELMDLKTKISIVVCGISVCFLYSEFVGLLAYDRIMQFKKFCQIGWPIFLKS